MGAHQIAAQTLAAAMCRRTARNGDLHRTVRWSVALFDVVYRRERK